MARGGARARSGPPPDPNALRRDRKSDAAKWNLLPTAGREGDVPEWPLSGRAAHISALTPPGLSQIKDEEEKQRILDRIENEASARFAREIEIWKREWRRPQAIEWERNRQELEVALYVRALVAAEAPDAKVTLRTLVKQQQEALGLSLPGLQRNNWKIERKDEPQGAKAPRASSSARDRFKVIDGDGEQS